LELFILVEAQHRAELAVYRSRQEGLNPRPGVGDASKVLSFSLSLAPKMLKYTSALRISARHSHSRDTDQPRDARVAEMAEDGIADHLFDQTSHFLLSSGRHKTIFLWHRRPATGSQA